MTRRLLAVCLAAVPLAACANPPTAPRTEVVTVTTTPAPPATSAAGPAPAPASSATTVSSSAARDTGVVVAPPPATTTTPSADAAGATLDASFAELQQRLSGPAGLAVTPVGGTGPTVVLGDRTVTPAWSTAKVPLAVATLEAFPSATNRALVHRAITASDNEAADRLWATLGGGEAAAGTVDATLAAGGDTITRTQSQHVAPPYSAFGQTRWSLTASATFAAHLPCMPQAAPVLAEMHQVTPSQRWGLGALPGAAIKGGWGPADAGYTVRQLAVVDAPGGGQAGVAVVVRSPRGFDAGVADLGHVITWLQAHPDALAGGRCP